MAVELRYFGVAFFEVKTEDGRTILIDPCITLCPGSPVKVEEFKAPGAILVTHSALDHIGDTLKILRNNNATPLICPRNVKTYVTRNGLAHAEIRPMVAGMMREAAGVKIKAFQTLHGGYLECDDGLCLADVSLAYMLYLRPDLKLLHMGDTALTTDLKMIGEIYKPDVALVPIGKFVGAETELNAYEAAVAVSWLNVKKAIPMHFDPETQAASPLEFAEHVKTMAPGVEVIHLPLGGSLII